MVRVRLPLGAILLALCSIALASSGGDTAPRRDNPAHGDNRAASNVAASFRDNIAASFQSHGDAASFQQWQQSNTAPPSSSFPRQRESNSLPFVHLRDSANGGFAAANGKQPSARSALIIRAPLRAMDSRLRGNDGIMGGLDSRLRGNDGLLGGDALRGLFMDVANGDNGDAFDNFYKMAQLRMLSALDDSLSAFAADALYDNDAIKSAGIRFQSPLGGRKAQLGADIIGAMDSANDETNQYAIGWQLHLYAAEKGNKGASGGFFYRRITNNILYGVNIFADYEDHDYGEFYRWGLGGELKNKHVKFAANYYLPVGGDKAINSTVLAYSREGYDANLQIAIPGASYLQAEAAYYYYEGKQKGEEDKGFRYGAALSPGKGVVVKVFYDDGGDDFGGELSWHYLFNNPGQKDPQRHDTPNISSADLFAPVLREYSQRIITAAVAFPVSLRISIVGIVTVAMTTEARTIRTTTAAGERMTTITRMTTDAVLAEMPELSFDFMTTRLASVEVTVRIRTSPNNPALAANFIMGTLNYPILATLPEVITRPLVLTQNFNVITLHQVNNSRVMMEQGTAPGVVVIESNVFNPGNVFSQGVDAVRPYTLTVVEGSETGRMTIATTTTMTLGTITTTTTPPITTATTTTIGGEAATTTTMTIPAISTTTTLTTYATTFITLTTSAMDSRFPGNDEKIAAIGNITDGAFPFDNANKGNEITKPPLAIALPPSSSFSRRRRGNLLFSLEIPALSTKNDGSKAPKGRHVVA